MRVTPGRVLIGLVAAVLLIAAAIALAVWGLVTPDRIRMTLEAQAATALGEPVTIGQLAVGYFPRVSLRLHDIHVGAPARLAISELDVSTGLRGLLSRRVEDAELTLRKSQINVPALLELVARLSAKPSGATPDAGASFEIVNVRAIALDNVTLTAGDQQITASARGTLQSNRLTLESLAAEGPGTSMTASGTIAFAPLDVTVRANAKTVDVDRLLSYLSAAFPTSAEAPAAAGGGTPPHLSMDVHADNGTVAGLQFSDLTTHVLMKGDQVTLAPFKTSLLGGRIDARLTRTAGSTPVVRLTGSLQDADTGRVLAWLQQPADVITGRLTATVQLTGTGAELASAAAWRGTAHAALTDGTLKGLSVVRSAVVSLAGRGERAMPTGVDRYDRIAGDFTLTGTGVDCRNLALHSSDLDLQGGGTIALPTGALALKVQVLLSPELSAQAGRDLYRYARDGDRIVLPATIGGRLGSPSVSVDVGSVAKRALENKVKEEAGSLLNRLFKKKP